ncbi:BON domain-containing protein [uncultured Desulfosarcina sp.]|uniref:BON domain-containing protein n=1 Tax=uncultured Desulfosarcina sp. TaxID=218289 RepID=UPI0029C6E7AE|nr:BON domain-containing protein [uncultured Desulfosarcina sp.]
MNLNFRSIAVLPAARQFHDNQWIRGRSWALRMTIFCTVLFMYRPATGRELTDSTIRESIGKHILYETAIAPGQVDIKVNDGIVMLSGTVNNLLRKDRVRQIAESIRGVRSVVNTVAVKPVVRENEVIARDVRNSLPQIPPDHGMDVSVSVDAGVVTLNGTADSWVLNRLAVHQAMSIKGVSEVVNLIDIKARLERDDKDLGLDVKRRLAADLYVDDALIEVTVKGGRVALEGIVGTAAEKRRAAEDAWIYGVAAVENKDLIVDWQEKDHMRRASPYISQSDQTILRAVEDALLMDPRVNAYNPDIFVVNGAVTLSGAVDTLYAKQAAADDARSTTGVWSVDNQLKLRYRFFPPDNEVASIIEDVFRRDAELHALDIIAAVKDNHVRLSGSVDTMGQKVRAENIATQIEGVLTLDNRITVNAKADRPSDADISAAIVDELFWSPYVDGDRIGVTVKDGQAVLTGNAAGRFVAHAAVQNAFEGGAETVWTKLVLDDGSTLNEVFREDTYQFRPGRIFSFRP